MSKNKNIISATIFIVAVLIAGVIIYSASDREVLKVDGLSEKEAGEISMNFINDVMLQGYGAKASLVNITTEYGLYKVDISFEGEEFSSYITKDGEKFFPEAIDIEEFMTMAELYNQPAPSVEDINLPETDDNFISCLQSAGLVIYGADWCPYCTQLVDLLGGKDVVAPIYVECTENETLCREKNIEGYPTVLIEGERYRGSRTVEAFASETGCTI